jgi:peroxiredoxin
VIDSAIIVKGRFVLNGKLDEPGRRIFQIKPGNWMFPAFIDVPQIAFNIDTTGAMHQYSNGKDYPSITRIKETGSPLANAYDAYKKETGQEEYLSLAGKIKLVGKDSAAAIMSKMDGIVAAFPAKGKIWTEKNIKQNPASFSTIFIFQEYFHESRDKSAGYLRSVMAQFSGAAKESALYQALNKELIVLENVQAGKIAPDFTLQKRDKSKLTLSSTRGTVVMLDFWASWCVPCRAGIPNWKKVYAKYHPKGFNIIGISDDRKWSEWVKALNKEKMPWTQVIDSFPDKKSPAIVGELYGIRYIPHFVLIGKEGEIIAASGDEEVMTKKIEEIFK